MIRLAVREENTVYTVGIMSAVLEQWTLADLEKGPDGKLYEIVRGERVEKVMSLRAIWIVTQVSHLLKDFAEGRKLGWVFAEMPIACFPWFDSVHGRRPEVLFVTREKLPDPSVEIPALRVPPDLCIEVISPNDNAEDLGEKIDEYLEAGVRLVWVLNPATRSVQVHRADGTGAYLRKADTISGEGILPDFSCPIADFFPPAKT